MSSNARQIDPQDSAIHNRDGDGARPSACKSARAEDFVLTFLERESLEEICRLENRCYPAPWSNNLIEGEFDKAVSFRLGIRLNGTIVAYSFNYLVADELHILNVAVAPEWRRHGLGRKLIEAILDSARSQGAQFAILEVRLSNEVARQLYEGAGFRVSGRRASYYRNNGEDALIMERIL